MADYYSTDRSAPDHTYSWEGCFIEGYEFDRERFRVSGNVFRAADLAHWDRAALETGLITPDTIINDTGSLRIGGVTFKNAGGAVHGAIALVLFGVAVMAAIFLLGGWGVLARVYLVPYFLVFPIAFALNRLGQHYAIVPEDPAKWGSVLKPSRWWDFWYLDSAYHLEHLERNRPIVKKVMNESGLIPVRYALR